MTPFDKLMWMGGKITQWVPLGEGLKVIKSG